MEEEEDIAVFCFVIGYITIPENHYILCVDESGIRTHNPILAAPSFLGNVLCL